MKFTLVSIASTAFFALASAQTIISITSPLSGTKFKAGQEALITWINPKVDSISKIVLARGSSSALQPISVIAENVNAADGKFSWKVPDNLPSAEDYALEFGTSPNLAFAGPIGIEGGDGSAAVPTVPQGSSSSNSTGMGSMAGSPSTISPAGPGSVGSTGANTNSASGNTKPLTGNSASSSSTTHSSSADSITNNLYLSGKAAAMGIAIVAAGQFF